MRIIKLLCLGVCLFVCGVSASAAETKKINNTVYQVSDQSLDQRLRLKKILLFPSVDDISGVFAPQLDDKLQRLFANHPRFELIRDPSVIKALAAEDSSYLKIAQSEKVHKEAARISGADATVVLRTRTVAGTIEMTMDWRDASGLLVYSEGGAIPGSATADARSALVASLLTSIIKKIPFIGTVTGRTAQTLTVDLGRADANVGDTIDLIKIVSIQRHPLLGVIVSADFVKVGSAKITGVDRALSFAEVTEEAPGETIRPDNKVLAIHHLMGERTLRPEPAAQLQSNKPDKFKVEGEQQDIDRLSGDFDKPKARFGSGYLDLQYGSLSHSQTSSSTLDISGGGLSATFGGELWITKNWIFALDYSSQSATLSGSQSGAQVAGGNASRKDIDVAGGYRIFPSGLTSGTAITFSLGYQATTVNIPDSSALQLSEKKYTGLFLRVGSDVFINDNNKIVLNVSFQPFSSLTDTAGYLGTPSSATEIGLDLFWAYQFANNLWLRAGFRFASSNGSYDSNYSVADKKFAIGPGLSYSF